MILPPGFQPDHFGKPPSPTPVEQFITIEVVMSKERTEKQYAN
jgi:hypothetical protein